MEPVNGAYIIVLEMSVILNKHNVLYYNRFIKVRGTHIAWLFILSSVLVIIIMILVLLYLFV